MRTEAIDTTTRLPVIAPALSRQEVVPVQSIAPRLRFSRRTTRPSPYPLAGRLSETGPRVGQYLDIRV
ncbi:MAG: hypothetical protein R3E82_04645 [Pseudomonadales bacterium]